jgi:hypothetical protein
MTSDFEDQLQTLFRSAERDLPLETFTVGLTARLTTQRRRTRLLVGAGVLATVVILWLLAPDIALGAVAVAGFPSVAFGLAGRFLRTLSESSLPSVLYLYGGVFAGYTLLKVLHYFRMRWAVNLGPF